MGLAASQARFLGITARKSNIEYEGQQVNQQRTALAEEVNALYNKLLSLKVPIAPATTDFFESKYTFEVADAASSNSGNYTIEQYYPNSDGKTYTVKTSHSYYEDVAESSRLTSDYWEKKDNNLILDKKNNIQYEVTQMDNIPDEQESTASNDLRKKVISEINKKIPTSKLPDNANIMAFNDTQTGQVHYIIGTLDNWSIPVTSYIEKSEEQKDFMTFSNAVINFDTNGRIKSIKLDPYDETTELTVNTKRDYNEEGYEEALKDYTMSKDEYDKSVEDLNARTKSLQQEDKILELRLNQIDTEQNELQTELEAVKAVLDKNIENTFNTFS
ncbi:hypothetical protein IJ182_10725 [bacterium]|nr:hypothetical protein [bacterium]